MYEYNNEYVPFRIRVPNMIGCHKIFGNDKKMNFRCENEELLEKYEEIFENKSQKKGK